MQFCERGLGDDQSALGLLGDVHAWSKTLFQSLLLLFPPPPDFVMDTSPILPPPITTCVYPLGISGGDNLYVESQGVHDFYSVYNGSDVIWGVVEENMRITNPLWVQDVRHISINISDGGNCYNTGDVAVIYPDNPGSIESLASILGLDPQGWFSGVQGLPSPCSVELLLRKYLDIYGVPKRYFFECLSSFATVEEERLKLLEMSSPEGADLFFEYCTREKRTYIEVLQQFPSARLPFDTLISLVPRIQVRFSCADDLSLMILILHPPFI